jgi:hypothetical protein
MHAVYIKAGHVDGRYLHIVDMDLHVTSYRTFCFISLRWSGKTDQNPMSTLFTF